MNLIKSIMMALIAVSVIDSAAADDASGVHHVKLACIGVKNKNDMPTVINMIQSDDKASLAQFVEDGEGIVIPAGARCYLVNSADFFRIGKFAWQESQDCGGSA